VLIYDIATFSNPEVVVAVVLAFSHDKALLFQLGLVVDGLNLGSMALF
jgi:hypothetical protein